MKYPTKTETESASYEDVCRWWRFLSSPTTEEELEVMDVIASRFKDGGGFTPELSRKVGWDRPAGEDHG